MIDVIKWPPFELTGFGIRSNFPISRSISFQDDTPRQSSAGSKRRKITATAAGIGTDQSGSGYLRALEELWGYNPKLVHIEAQSAIWHLARQTEDLQNNILEWTNGGDEMFWTSGANGLIWSDNRAMRATAGVVDGYPTVSISGLPPNRVCGRVSEMITVANATQTQQRMIKKGAVSNSDGVAVFRLFEAFTFNGLASIGTAETMVCEVIGRPEAVQGVGSNYGFTFNLTEVVASDSVLAAGYQIEDPW